MKMNRLALLLSVLALMGLVAAVPPLTAEEGEPQDPGMNVYNKKCAMCHGKDGVAKAMAKGSANLNDPEWQKATSVDAIVKITVEGKGKMPKYADKLTAEEIKATADYILTLK